MRLDIKFVRYLLTRGNKNPPEEIGDSVPKFDEQTGHFQGDDSELRTAGVLLALNGELNMNEEDAITDDFLAALAEHPDEFGVNDAWNLTAVSASLIRKLGCAEQAFQVMAECGDDPAIGFKALLKGLKKLGIAVPKSKRAWAALKPASEEKK